jgi:protein gp37
MMSANSKIEWTDHTFNPWEGCTKVGPGCDHCYAEVRNARFAGGQSINWGAGAPRRRTSESNWRLPLRWNAQKFYQCACGWRGHDVNTEGTSLTAGLPSCPECDSMDLRDARQRVFCASLADVFDNEVPREWRYDLLWLISNTPNLDWLLLTKRIGNAHQMLTEECARMGFPWSPKRWHNVWIGATICNQEEADRDIPKLLDVPAAVRFLSMEPLLGPVDLTHINDGKEVWEVSCLSAWTWEQEIENWRGTSDEWEEDFKDWYNLSEMPSGPMHNVLDWVIVGGESGPHARPMHPDWARSLRDQCAAAGVPFLFKQWGEWLPFNHFPYQDLSIHRADVVDHAGIYLDGTSSGDSFRYPKEISAKLYKVGKKDAGRLLDGVEHNGYPKP